MTDFSPLNAEIDAVLASMKPATDSVDGPIRQGVRLFLDYEEKEVSLDGLWIFPSEGGWVNPSTDLYEALLSTQKDQLMEYIRKRWDGMNEA